MRKILTVDEVIKSMYKSDLNELTQDAVYWLDKLKSENEQLKKAHSKYQAGLIVGTCVAALFSLLIKII